MLHFIRQLPSATIPVATVVLLVAGMAVRGPGGAVCLLVLAVLLGWLAYLSWPSLDARGRSLRVLALVVVVGVAALQVTR
jgi:hypothetical protein